MKRSQSLIAMGVVGGLLFIGIAAYVLAGISGGDSDRPVFSAAWALCDGGDSCVAVPAPCGQWEPVNNRHAEDAAKYYGHLITVVEETEMQCLRASLSTRRPDAFCVSGTCMLTR